MKKEDKIRGFGLGVQIISVAIILLLQWFGYVGLLISMSVILLGLAFSLFMNGYATNIALNRVLDALGKIERDIEQFEKEIIKH